MNNEIKEILAYFEEYVKITDMHDSEPMLNWKDLKIVLDYIINLQQENQELNDSVVWWNNRFNAVERNNRDYKTRIEKAVEYMVICGETHDAGNYAQFKDYEEYKHLLNILNGGSNE